MKKLGLALIAAVAMSAPAFAADMRMPVKAAPAPIAAPVYSWTGCYIGAGGGGAITNNDHYTNASLSGLESGPFLQLTPNDSLTAGARGWFGTVQVGCDYQFGNFVVGAFGDYDFMSVKGDFAPSFVGLPFQGSQKQDWQWAVGGRVGYLIFPQLLTYVSGGFTQAHWKTTTLSIAGTPVFDLAGQTRNGWFIGTGDEYALSMIPGLFWKTEYRYSEFNSGNAPLYETGTKIYTNLSENQKVREHSVRSELVYRFNWMK